MKKKLLSVMMIALAAFVLLPTVKSVSANTEDYATVDSSITNLGDVVKETITAEGDPATLNVKISDIELNWSDDSEEGRTNGWWAGVKVNAPTGIKEDESTITKEDGTTYKFSEVKDSTESPEFVYLWLYLDKTMEGSKTYKYNFKWVKDADLKKVTYQTITFTVNFTEDNLKAPEEGKYITVTVNGNGSREFFLEKDKEKNLGALSELDKKALEKIKTPNEGYEYVGIFDEKGTEYKDDTEITEDITLNVQFKKVVTATGSELDKTPKTGNNNLIGFISIITLISLAGAVTLKRRMQ